MPANLMKAKALLGITDNISGIYKLSETQKAELRGVYQNNAIDLAKGRTNEEQKKEIEGAHDFILSYLNLPSDLFAKLKSGEVSLQNEAVREAIINDPDLLQQILADKTFITEKLQSNNQFDIASDTENYKAIREGTLLLDTIAQGIINQPELKDAIMKNIESFPNTVQGDLRAQIKKNEAQEDFNKRFNNINDQHPDWVFAKAMENHEYAERLLSNEDAQKKLDPIHLRSILDYPPNRSLYGKTHFATEETLATLIASQNAQNAQKLLIDSNAKPYIRILKVVESLIEKGDVGDIVDVIRSDPDNNISALAQRDKMIAAAFATNPKLSAKLNNNEKTAIEELHQNNLAVDYLLSHPEESKKIGLDDNCLVTGIVKEPNGDYRLQFNRQISKGQDIGLVGITSKEEEISINKDDVARFAQLQANPEKQQTNQDTPNTPPPIKHQTQERTATVPLDPPKPMKPEDALKNMSEMVAKIFKDIDPAHSTFKAQLDSSLTAMITKGEKPVFSVQPEKITLMEPFGKPPGSQADIDKVELLVKAGNAAFGKAIIYSTNPAHKEFLQQQAQRLGVDFADTPEKLAALKEQRAARLGTTITPSDTTHPTPNPTFGSRDPQAQQAMLDAQTHASKPLPPIPQKTEFQQALGALRSNDENVRREYLKTILTGNNQFFEIKDKGAGGTEISIKDTNKLNDAQGKALAQAFVQASGKVLMPAQFDTDETKKKIILSSHHFDSLKNSLGVDETIKHQQQTSHNSGSSPTTPPKSPAQEAIEALNGDKRNEYLKDLIEKGENDIFKFEEEKDGKVKISTKDDLFINNYEGGKLTNSLSSAIGELLNPKKDESNKMILGFYLNLQGQAGCSFTDPGARSLKQALGISNPTLKI